MLLYKGSVWRLVDVGIRWDESLRFISQGH